MKSCNGDQTVYALMRAPALVWCLTLLCSPTLADSLWAGAEVLTNNTGVRVNDLEYDLCLTDWDFDHGYRIRAASVGSDVFPYNTAEISSDQSCVAVTHWGETVNNGSSVYVHYSATISPDWNWLEKENIRWTIDGQPAGEAGIQHGWGMGPTIDGSCDFAIENLENWTIFAYDLVYLVTDEFPGSENLRYLTGWEPIPDVPDMVPIEPGDTTEAMPIGAELGQFVNWRAEMELPGLGLTEVVYGSHETFIPEPGTACLFGLAGLVLLRRRGA